MCKYTKNAQQIRNFAQHITLLCSGVQTLDFGLILGVGPEFLFSILLVFSCFRWFISCCRATVFGLISIDFRLRRMEGFESRGSHKELKIRNLLASSLFFVLKVRRELAPESTFGTKNKWSRLARLLDFQLFAQDVGRRPGNAQAPLAPSTIPCPARECAGIFDAEHNPLPLPSSYQPSYEDGTYYFRPPSSDSPLFEDGAIRANAHTDKSEFNYCRQSSTTYNSPL